MKTVDFAGGHVALYTPMSADGSLDVAALEGLADRVASAGLGLVACGTTGETPTLTAQEYDTVVSTAVRVAAGRVPVIAGTGTNNTRSTIEQTQRAAALGVDGALVVVPYYNKPPQTALIEHFTAVAEASTVPLMLYNVPGRTGTNMNAETTLALTGHPMVVAVKEASANLDQIQRLLTHAPEGFSILSGDDAWTTPIMLLGGHGVVSVAGNVVPRALSRLIRACSTGDLPEARRVHRELLPLFDALFVTSNPIPVKFAAACLEHAQPTVRRPLSHDALGDSDRRLVRAALERAWGEETT